jgi:hypothetical protein
MDRAKRVLLASIAVIGTFSGCVAQAMRIPDFDRMAKRDQDAYVALLTQGAAEALDARGDHAQSKKLLALFTEDSSDGGAKQFAKNLHIMRIVNRTNAVDRGNKQPPYQTEDAFVLTLKNNGIRIPIDVLLKIDSRFNPSARTE